MARNYARLYCSIWNDPDFRQLNQGEQHLYLMLASQRDVSYCGVLVYLPHRLARLTSDLYPAQVQETVQALERAAFVQADDDTGELLVRAFVRWDGVLEGPKIAKAMVKDFHSVESTTLRDTIVAELQRHHADEPHLRGWVGIQQADGQLWEAVQA